MAFDFAYQPTTFISTIMSRLFIQKKRLELLSWILSSIPNVKYPFFEC